MTRGRRIGLLVGAAGVVFGLAGGEYGTLDWWTLKRDVTRETRAIAELTTEIDSLADVAQGLERDRQVQERVAREQFGMLRPGELLFRVEPPPR